MKPLCPDDKHEWGEPDADGRHRCKVCDCPSLSLREMDAVARVRSVMREVPLSDVEKLPDPDYGF